MTVGMGNKWKEHPHPRIVYHLFQCLAIWRSLKCFPPDDTKRKRDMFTFPKNFIYGSFCNFQEHINTGRRAFKILWERRSFGDYWFFRSGRAFGSITYKICFFQSLKNANVLKKNYWQMLSMKASLN